VVSEIKKIKKIRKPFTVKKRTKLPLIHSYLSQSPNPLLYPLCLFVLFSSETLT
jgi:hypothetical protein